VSNPDTSRDVRDEQLKNIVPMFVTEEVSNPDTSRDVRDEQLRNILFIFVTEEVSVLPPAKLVMFEQP
jgi:hypothetical protein